MKIPYKPQQSPIDLGIATWIAAVFPPCYLDLRWDGPLNGEIECSTGGIEFVFKRIDENVGLCLGGKFFQLLRYHFHAPSEHKVKYEEWPLEVHVVHQNPEDKLYAVLGIMVEGGKGRPETNRFFKELTQQRSKKDKSDSTVAHDPRHLLPVDRGDFFRYEGSLTTNPNEDNDETVSWLIFREPLKVDDETLQEFIRDGHQAKCVQDPARRFVLCNFIPCE